MKLEDLTKTIREVTDAEFALDGRGDHLHAKLYKGGGNGWRIGIRITKDDNNSKAYAQIYFQLTIEGREIILPADSIGFDSINKTMDYAKTKFIDHLNGLDISISNR